jgi:hypothetical protein
MTWGNDLQIGWVFPRSALTKARYCHTRSRIKTDAVGETNIPKVSQLTKEQPNMGDRSPKSVQKHASQKQSKSDNSNQKKNALIQAQQATKAKAAAAKKKK